MNRGGARYGAGRPGWHVQAEDCRRLDVRDLHHAGLLQPGEVGTVHWPDRRQARITVEGDTVMLNHHLLGRPATQMLKIVSTACHYGGTRPWFSCPRCSRRSAVMFLRSDEFVCRQCGAVAYACQREDAFDRALRRQRKAEQQLGAGGERPAGMRHAVYNAILARIADAESRRIAAMAETVERLSGFRLRVNLSPESDR